MTTYTKRTNAKRAAIAAGIPADQVEITVHKSKGEVRFGFKQCEPAAAAPVVTTPASAPELILTGVTSAEREVRNGVKRPREGGACAAVWTDLDKLMASGSEPTSQQIKDLAVARGANVNNALIELSQWRKFMGLSRPQRARGPKLPRGSAEEMIPYTA